MDRQKYEEEEFDGIIKAIKEIEIPKISIDRNMIMREIGGRKVRHAAWRFIAPVVWSYFTVSILYFFYYFRGIILNIFLYYAEDKLRWVAKTVLNLIKIISVIPNGVLIILMVIPILSIMVLFLIKLVILHRKMRRKYGKKIY